MLLPLTNRTHLEFPVSRLTDEQVRWQDPRGPCARWAVPVGQGVGAGSAVPASPSAAFPRCLKDVSAAGRCPGTAVMARLGTDLRRPHRQFSEFVLLLSLVVCAPLQGQGL